MTFGFTFEKEIEGGHGSYAEFSCELGKLIDIYFQKNNSGIFIAKIVNKRRNLFARTTPLNK